MINQGIYSNYLFRVVYVDHSATAHRPTIADSPPANLKLRRVQGPPALNRNNNKKTVVSNNNSPDVIEHALKGGTKTIPINNLPQFLRPVLRR